MLVSMDDREIERLRKAIRNSFASQPHKIKYWLALLDMYAKRLENAGDGARGPERGRRRTGETQGTD
jgi:hypothetical protein